MALDRYFSDYNFWMEPLPGEFDSRPDMEELIEHLDVLPFTPKTTPHLLDFAKRLLTRILRAVSSMTGCFVLSYHLGEEFVNRKKVVKEHRVEYFLDDAYLIDRKSFKPLIISHIHADDALDSSENVKYAEDFMRSALEEWVDCARMRVLYGAIIIGANMALYQMDKRSKTFSRIDDGHSEKIESTPSMKKWMRLTPTDGLGKLLNVVMKSWNKLHPEIVKKGIEFRRKKLEELGIKPGNVMKEACKNEDVKKEDVTNADVDKEDVANAHVEKEDVTDADVEKEDVKNEDVKALDRTRTVSGEISSSKASADSGVIVLGSDRESSPDRDQLVLVGSSSSESSPEKSETSETDIADRIQDSTF